MTIIGVVVFFSTSSMIPSSYIEVEGIEINQNEAIISLILLALAALAPILSFIFIRLSGILGTIYSFAQGYVLSFLIHAIGYSYVYPCLIALGLTILLVLVMLALYRLKLVKIDSKFISVVTTVIVMLALCSLLVFIAYQIPQFKEFAEFIYENRVVAITCGSVLVAIASLLLLVDFEVIHHCTEEHLDKKYEWLGAFALSFSIIELYFKILTLVLRLTSKKESKN